MIYTEIDALEAAATVGSSSPCAKSKRGVVIFTRSGLVAAGYNHPPAPMRCDGSTACREHCNKLCIHAEDDAIQHLIAIDPRGQYACSWTGEIIGHRAEDTGLQMLHVKVVDGHAVPSRAPSCWQCSRTILGSGKIDRMWLLHAEGLRSYTSLEFHETTLRNCHLPVIKESR